MKYHFLVENVLVVMVSDVFIDNVVNELFERVLALVGVEAGGINYSHRVLLTTWNIGNKIITTTIMIINIG